MTEKKTAANKRNALKSTGPRTSEGKKRASMNALKHGLRAVSLAVPFLENPEDWRVHHELVVRDLAPVGYLETIFAERIAALLWRLGRVVRYETEVVSLAMTEGEAVSLHTPTLQDLKNFLETAEEKGETLARVRGLKGKAHVSGEDAALVLDAVADALGVDLYPEDGEPLEVSIPGVPEEEVWEDFDGWTRDKVEAGVRAIHAHRTDAYPLTVDPWALALGRASSAKTVALLQYQSEEDRVDRNRRRALLPSEKTLDKVSRYETTLERSLFRTLHELQRLQDARSGRPVLPPVALDVDVVVSEAS